MPPRGNEWLALTTEAILEPDLPICDPHHHFWVQRPEPEDYQQYLLADLAADIGSGHNVRSTVFRGPVHVPRRRPGRDASGG
jgi:hypothetical protein